MEKPKLIDKLSTRLPPPVNDTLEAILRAADRRSITVYLVGGPIRDLLLDRDLLDLDLSVESDARVLARATQSTHVTRVVEHTAFLTATLKGARFSIDIATARSETYPQPGALPLVTPASIRDDLLRRDFTINAMAMPLNGPQVSSLVDPVGGRSDLRNRVIRILHDDSFRDDATRAFRAARYEARFGFEIEPTTLKRLRESVRYTSSISGARLRQEFNRTFAEQAPERPLRRLDRTGVLASVHPSLAFGDAEECGVARLREAGGPLPTAAWPLLAWRLTQGATRALSERLALTRSQRAAAESVTLIRASVGRLGSDESPEKVVEALEAHPLAAVWAAFAMTEDDRVRRQCLQYLRRLRYIRPVLRGDDVIGLGIPQGPEVGRVLRRLRVAKLNGEVRTRKQEEELVRAMTSL